MDCLSCKQGTDALFCGSCATAPYAEVIERACIQSTDRDPIALADKIMHHPTFPVAGQAHHPLVAAVLLTSLRNSGVQVSEDQIRQGIKRADQLPAGYCAGFGSDAAAIACGISVAVLERTTVKAEHAAGRSLAHLLTGQAMLAIAANSGNRCCKRSVFTVLDVASTFFISTRGLGLERPASRIQCRFWGSNPHCNQQSCRFFPDSASTGGPEAGPGFRLPVIAQP